jgi:very-short-patch-repair endonuclease
MKLIELPEIAKEFHPSKNEPLKLEDVTVGSRSKVWWRCHKGHEYSATPNSRLGRREKGKIQGCPYCSGRLASPDNNLLVCFPDIAKELDEKKSGLRASSIAPSSGQNVWWRCSEGHSYKSRVANRTQLGTGCKYCGTGNLSPRAASDEYNLAVDYPHIASQWHPLKNGNLAPSEVTSGSKQIVWWSCKKGCEWRAQINGRTNGNSCPFCSGNKVGFGNDLKSLSPDIASEWDYKKNYPSRPEDYTNGSGKKAWWVCSKKHSWDAVIGSRTRKGYGCPHCTNQSSRAEIRLLTELLYFFPQSKSRIKLEGKEADIFVEELNLVIEYDGAHWHGGKELKDIKKSNFFESLGKQVIRVRERPLPSITSNCIEVDADIFENKLEVNRVFSFILLRFSNLILKNVLSSLKQYQSHSEFQNKAEYNRYLSYFPSPFPEHSLQEKFPKVSSEWHPTKNSPLTPRHFTSNTNALVWWICNKGHEWEASISSRTPSGKKIKGGGCPYCSGHRVSDLNSISSIFPMFVDEWHPTKNGVNTPDNISYGNRTIKIWWICKSGHEWSSTANKRFGNVKRRGEKSIKTCPHCKD